MFYYLLKLLGEESPVSEDCSELDFKNIQNTKLRTIQQLFRCYGSGARINLLKDCLAKLQKDNNDRGVSVLTSVFFKILFRDEPEQMRVLLEVTREFWLKNTLNCLRDEDKYILDIVATLQQSMALLQYLLILEKRENIQPPMLREIKSLRQIRKEYLEPLVHTIDAGMKSIDEETNAQPQAKDVFEQRKMQLYILHD